MIKTLTKEQIYVTVGTRLKETRIRIGLSAVEVATTLKIEKSAMSHYENGSNCPTALNLIKLCMLYKVSPSYILGFEQNPKDYSMKEMEQIFKQFNGVGAILVTEPKSK